MAEKPLNLEQFFMTRNEIATRHNSKLEFLAMDRVREQMVQEQIKQAEEEASKAKKK